LLGLPLVTTLPAKADLLNYSVTGTVTFSSIPDNYPPTIFPDIQPGDPVIGTITADSTCPLCLAGFSLEVYEFSLAYQLQSSSPSADPFFGITFDTSTLTLRGNLIDGAEQFHVSGTGGTGRWIFDQDAVHIDGTLVVGVPEPGSWVLLGGILVPIIFLAKSHRLLTKIRSS
jgi:hypothetical protein